MQKFKRIMRVWMFYALIPLIAGGYSLTVLAEDTVPPPPAYTYDATTQHWNTDAWVFDSESGTYKPKPIPVVPQQSDPAPSEALVPTERPANNQPSSSSSGTATNTTDTTVNVENNSSSAAQSGTAEVGNNTTAGNATSGNAAASTTIVNTIHTTNAGDTLGVSHFTSDIYGNVTGDITLMPTINDLSAQPSNGDTKTTVSNSAVVTNNVTVTAGSGDATVSHNTNAGSATTGSAHAVANVINLINSIIAANKSFIGTINIYGNLNGDILISPEFIPQLLASNKQEADGSVISEDNQSIINNIHLGASSGSAEVSNNTTAGQAKTGSASTNLTIFNLSGHRVTASNSLLVFVNVLGTWVGVIVDAPGATAAMLGSGVTSNSGGASQNVTSTNESQIINNIEVTASSGNASVANNTSAGDATSGDATASANILNIITGNISLSDWFGVLFINVFGRWDGSFGVDTDSGNLPPSPTTSAPQTNAIQQMLAVRFGFRPHTSSDQQSTSGGEVAGEGSDPGSVLGILTSDAPTQSLTSTKAPTKPAVDLFIVIPVALLLLATGATLLSRRSSHMSFTPHT